MACIIYNIKIVFIVTYYMKRKKVCSYVPGTEKKKKNVALTNF